MFVLVGVDADDDIVGRSFMVGMAAVTSQIPVFEPLVGRADRSAMGPGWVRL